MAAPLLMQAQTLLNGDFEACSEPICRYNLPNPMFNAAMSGVTAFSNTVWSGGTGETDILRNNCLGGPHGGTYAVMIACEATTSDRLAMHLSAPMAAGTTHRLLLFAKGNTLFNPLHDFEVGYSNSPTSFGTSVAVITPADGAWSQHEVLITPATNAGYITFQVVQDGSNGAVILDDMDLSVAASVVDRPSAGQPSPFRHAGATGLVDYVLHRPAAIDLLDAYGRIIRTVPMTGSGTLDLTALAGGIYLLRATVDGQTTTTRILKP